MTVTSPFEAASAGIIQAINTEFAPEGLTCVADKLHESLGRRRMAAGVSPLYDTYRSSNALVQDTALLVQFYGLWDDKISPDTVVNPSTITNYAERFRRALRAVEAASARSSHLWFYQIERIDYPDDPTGNKTRFEARVLAVSQNANLVETTG